MADTAAKGESSRVRAMRAVLARWQQSGLPLSRFAEREGIGRKTLSRWRLRLGVGGRRLRPGRPKRAPDRVGRVASALKFIELNRQRPMAAGTAMSFEVELPDGTTVRVPPAFDASALRALLETLRQC